MTEKINQVLNDIDNVKDYTLLKNLSLEERLFLMEHVDKFKLPFLNNEEQMYSFFGTLFTSEEAKKVLSGPINMEDDNLVYSLIMSLSDYEKIIYLTDERFSNYLDGITSTMDSAFLLNYVNSLTNLKLKTKLIPYVKSDNLKLQFLAANNLTEAEKFLIFKKLENKQYVIDNLNLLNDEDKANIIAYYWGIFDIHTRLKAYKKIENVELRLNQYGLEKRFYKDITLEEYDYFTDADKYFILENQIKDLNLNDNYILQVAAKINDDKYKAMAFSHLNDDELKAIQVSKVSNKIIIIKSIKKDEIRFLQLQYLDSTQKQDILDIVINLVDQNLRLEGLKYFSDDTDKLKIIATLSGQNKVDGIFKLNDISLILNEKNNLQLTDYEKQTIIKNIYDYDNREKGYIQVNLASSYPDSEAVKLLRYIIKESDRTSLICSFKNPVLKFEGLTYIYSPENFLAIIRSIGENDEFINSNYTVIVDEINRNNISLTDIPIFCIRNKNVFNNISDAIFSGYFGWSKSNAPLIMAEKKKKLFKLLTLNSEILKTLNPDFINLDIPFEYMERLGNYGELQERMLKLSNEKVQVIKKIMLSLDTSRYDINPIIYEILEHIDEYSSLVYYLQDKELSDTELKNLIFILSNKNIYGISGYKDLKAYDKIVLKKYRNDVENIEKNNVSNGELKEIVLNYKFGLAYEKAKFIDDRYCSDVDAIKNSDISENIKNVLLSIHDILETEDTEKLKFIFLTSSCLENDFYSSIVLESVIRAEFAKIYSDSLYQPKEQDRLGNCKVTSEVMNSLVKANYRGKKPEVYILHDDFNLQTTVLGAYGNFERPDNFKIDWEQPLIYHHGICTSYIANNEIAPARESGHPIYGFSHYEGGALLLAAPNDIGSNQEDKEFNTSSKLTCEFLPPKNMIDKTRHTHNEMVLERRNTSKDGVNFKKMPDYVVYMVDDINNLDNFDQDNNLLFSETVQAAIDHNIPIVIVDRLYYAKREKKKCSEMLEKFKITLDSAILKELLTNIGNNMIGCAYYENQTPAQYHQEFNDHYLNSVINTIVEEIEKQEINNRNKLLKILNQIVINDDLLQEKIGTKTKKLVQNIEFEQIENKEENKADIGKFLVDYYKNASLDIKTQIREDAKNLDWITIYQKIINNEYETRSL